MRCAVAWIINWLCFSFDSQKPYARAECRSDNDVAVRVKRLWLLCFVVAALRDSQFSVVTFNNFVPCVKVDNISKATIFLFDCIGSRIDGSRIKSRSITDCMLPLRQQPILLVPGGAGLYICHKRETKC